MTSRVTYYVLPLLLVIALALFFGGITISNFSDSSLINWFKGFVSQFEETKIVLFKIPEIPQPNPISFDGGGLAIQAILRAITAIVYFINKLIVLNNFIISALEMVLNVVAFAFKLILGFQNYVSGLA